MRAGEDHSGRLRRPPAQAARRSERRASTRSRTSSRASSRSPRFAPRHAALQPGEETDARAPGRGAARRAPRPGEDGVPRPGRPLRPDPAPGAGRRARRGGDGAAARARSRRRDRRRRGRVQHPSRRADAADRALRAARQVAAPAAGEAPRPEGRRDALPPPRARPDRQRGGARAVHPARAGRSPRSARSSTRRGSSRSRRRCSSRSTAARSARPFTTHHNALDRDPVPADRDRAVPQAADRGRARARLRARQGLPQRGRRHDPQPRVHDARVVRGVRRLPGRSRPASSGWWPSSPRRSATRARSTSRRHGGARTLAEAIRDRDRDRHPRPPRSRRARGRDASRAGSAVPEEDTWPQLVDELSPSTSSRR